MLGTRKILPVLFLFLSALCLAGCGGELPKDEGSLSVVCAMFPEYDWTRNLAGDADNIEITYLIGNGTDSHSYQPTAKDMVLLETADLVIYGGGQSEQWMTDALAGDAKNPDRTVINMMEVLKDRTYTEEETEGMQEERAEEEPETDEHVWLSLRNAEMVCKAITEALSDKEPASKDVFTANYGAYEEKLAELDNRYVEMVAAASKDSILVVDRFPFRYLVEDYGIGYHAAFSGCSADAEASFETLVFLADRIRAGETKVCILESSDRKLAEAAIRTAERDDCQILTLDSMQAVTKERAEEGASYLNIMESNLEALKEALN